MSITAAIICELNAGIRSAEEEGWISADDFRNHFIDKGEKMRGGQQVLAEKDKFQNKAEG